jgi:hypothetical protein
MSGYADGVDARAEPLPALWVVVATEQRPALESELQAELSPKHPLSGARVTAIARCSACDDVVFSLATDPARFARVHLTWRRAPEPPPWPITEFLPRLLTPALANHDH